MRKKLLHVTKYIAYALLSAAIYGVSMYYYVPYPGDSPLHAYLWNIGFIVFAMALDKLINSVLLSKKLVITRKNYRIVKYLSADLSISFKTAIYLFYTFILIVSQMDANGLTFMSEDFMAFAHSIEYCVLLVVAVDAFLGNLTKDMERKDKIAEKIASYKQEK